MKLQTSKFSEKFLGFRIADCAVRKRDFFYFVAREDNFQWADWEDEGDYPNEESLEKRIITYLGSRPLDKQWGHGTLNAFTKLTCEVSSLPREQLIVGSLSGQIYILGGGEDEIQGNIRNQLKGSLNKLSNIDGKLYLAGSGRTVGVREGKDDWNFITTTVPYDIESEISTAGFDAVDGFSQNDVYAAGGKGDVWHFNGDRWRRVDFPSNLNIETVCCGADGRVYISGYEGHTFVGRGDTWKKIKSKERISLSFTDMVWYEDRIWCTNDYGLWWIVNDELVKADVPVCAQISAGHLSARDGVLLVAGFYGASYLENGQWTEIFSYNQMVERCKEEGLYDGVLKARWHEFKD